MGKASHITGASPGGARYDPKLSPSERRGIDNGIFLCAVCADLIDKNGGKDFPTDLLRKWKRDHDEWVRGNFNKSAHSFVQVRAPQISITFDDGASRVEITKPKADRQYRKHKSELSDRIIRIDPLLHNTGDAPATNIDVMLEFDAALSLYRGKELRGLWSVFPHDIFKDTRKFFEYLQRQRTMPVRERMINTVVDELGFGVFESLIAPTRKRHQDANGQLARAMVDRNRVSFKIAKLKQNLSQMLESVYIVYGCWSDVGSVRINYRINLEECVNDVTGVLEVTVRKGSDKSKPRGSATDS